MRGLTFLQVFEADSVTGHTLLTGEIVGPEGRVAGPLTLTLNVDKPGIVAAILKIDLDVKIPGQYRAVGSGEYVTPFEQPFSVTLREGSA
jgi:hypothetical protein